ncbi:hypothetical protein GCM10025868_32010 [Angustibacter aerolatus]|uniref:ER-bound oxygenase mpaB/mpaB'/Rubber oxygenase catalytic domain-containing protein n=1 Tax=Angustibacter aerolatus TaxID=1162965 RepID=A0ABQ6JMK4_9ACTN|nr:hypothetical protein GCM10025868_32010 [Angustibacter aerolatus]
MQPLAAVVLGRAVLDWAGVPGTPEEQARRAHDLWQVVDGFGSLGPRYARARLARRRTEQAAARRRPRGARRPGVRRPGGRGGGRAPGRRRAAARRTHRGGGACTTWCDPLSRCPGW